MNIQTLAKQFLKIASAEQSDTGLVNTCPIVEQLKLSPQEARSVISYLTDNRYVGGVLNGIGMPFPFGFKITGAGFNWMNDYNPNAQTIQNISIETNNGSVGNGNIITINNHFDFSRFDEAVAANVAKDSPDYQEIQELRERLKCIEDNEIPISKGYFSKFSALMQKHSWLTSQVAGFLIRWVSPI